MPKSQRRNQRQNKNRNRSRKQRGGRDLNIIIKEIGELSDKVRVNEQNIQELKEEIVDKSKEIISEASPNDTKNNVFDTMVENVFGESNEGEDISNKKVVSEVTPDVVTPVAETPVETSDKPHDEIDGGRRRKTNKRNNKKNRKSQRKQRRR